MDSIACGSGRQGKTENKKIRRGEREIERERERDWII